jgi:hypothetical protein
VIARPFAGPHITLDAGGDQAAGKGRAKQQVIDAQSGVAGERVPEIFPEGVDSLVRVRSGWARKKRGYSRPNNLWTCARQRLQKKNVSVLCHIYVFSREYLSKIAIIWFDFIPDVQDFNLDGADVLSAVSDWQADYRGLSRLAHTHRAVIPSGRVPRRR